MHPSDEGYWCTRTREVPTWPERDPAPTMLSTDPMPAGVTVPGPVRGLADLGRGMGWPVRVGYSCGQQRAQKSGTYREVGAFGVWAGPHPATGWRWMALHDGKAWMRTAIWLPAHPPRFTHAGVTDLKEWLSVRGDVGKPWFKAIVAREHEKAERARVAARSRTGKAKEGAS